MTVRVLPWFWNVAPPAVTMGSSGLPSVTTGKHVATASAMARGVKRWRWRVGRALTVAVSEVHSGDALQPLIAATLQAARLHDHAVVEAQ